MLRWASENLLQLKPEEIGEHYGRYRLHVPEAERAMAKSLERYGQLSPVPPLVASKPAAGLSPASRRPAAPKPPMLALVPFEHYNVRHGMSCSTRSGSWLSPDKRRRFRLM